TVTANEDIGNGAADDMVVTGERAEVLDARENDAAAAADLAADHRSCGEVDVHAAGIPNRDAVDAVAPAHGVAYMAAVVKKEAKRIIASAAVERVAAQPAVDEIIPRTARYRVVAGRTRSVWIDKYRARGVTEERIIAGA